jgi:hypothetical protein
MRNPTYLLLTTLALVAAGSVSTYGAENDAIIKNALSAAPAGVAKNATVVTFDDKMQMVVLKKGTNGYTCLPDDPSTPTSDPMCGDEGIMAWFQAYVSKQPPPEGKIGFAYMLQGATTASNTDPFATQPPAGGQWQKDGPHVMIMNAKELNALYPQTGENPDTTQPYVMWPGTPYAHLMIPVGAQ